MVRPYKKKTNIDVSPGDHIQKQENSNYYLAEIGGTVRTTSLSFNCTRKIYTG